MLHSCILCLYDKTVRADLHKSVVSLHFAQKKKNIDTFSNSILFFYNIFLHCKLLQTGLGSCQNARSCKCMLTFNTKRAKQSQFNNLKENEIGELGKQI